MTGSLGLSNPIEQGGTIAIKFNVSFIVVRWKPGTYKSIRPNIYRNGKIGKDKIVASFHVHPNPGKGWKQGPSKADLRWFRKNKKSAGDYHFILSKEKIYLLKRNSNNKIIESDFAPSKGNIRQAKEGANGGDEEDEI